MPTTDTHTSHIDTAFATAAMVGRSVGNRELSNSVSDNWCNELCETFSRHGFAKTASSFLDDCKKVCRSFDLSDMSLQTICVSCSLPFSLHRIPQTSFHCIERMAGRLYLLFLFCVLFLSIVFAIEI